MEAKGSRDVEVFLVAIVSVVFVVVQGNRTHAWVKHMSDVHFASSPPYTFTWAEIDALLRCQLRQP